MNIPKIPLTCLSVATLVALVGCGGSSSSNYAPPPDDTNEPPVTDVEGSGISLAGVATKGVLKSAEVNAYELNEQGERLGGAVGTAQTDSDGGYELELTDEYQGGMLEVEVSAIEGTTKMVCDASRCGESERFADIDLPADFSLTAIVEKDEDANSVSASVTAWSSMAASRTRALLSEGASDLRAARRQASSEVSQVVGFDIEQTGSRGLSQISGASAAESQYAVMNAAVAQVLFRDDDGTSLGEKLTAFARALDDGSVGGRGDSFTISDLSQAVNQVMSSTPSLDSDAADALSNQTAQYDSSGSDGFAPNYDQDLVVDENSSTNDKIDAYMRFITQANTWTQSLGELDGNALAVAAQADAETVQATLSPKTQSQFEFLTVVVDQVTQYAHNNAERMLELLEQSGSETIDITNGDQVVGTVTLDVADDNGLAITMVGAVTGADQDGFAPFALLLSTSIPASAIDIEVNGSSFLTAISEQNTLNLTGHVGDRSGEHYLELDNLELVISFDQALEVAGGELFQREDLEAAYRSASFDGGVKIHSKGNEFNGDVSASFVRLNDDARMLGEYGSGPANIERLRVTGDFLSADGRYNFSASASARIDNAVSFDAFTWSDSSGLRLWVWGESDYQEMMALTPELGDGAVASNVHLVMSYGAGGDLSAGENISGQFYVTDFYQLDELRDYQYSLDEERAQRLLDALRPELESELPVSVEASSYDSDESSSLPLAQLISEGDLTNVYSWSENSLSVNFFVSADLMPEELGPYGQFQSDSGVVSGYFDIYGDEAYIGLTSEEPSLTARVLETMGQELATDKLLTHEFEISAFGRYTVRENDVQEYQECLQDPEAYIYNRYSGQRIYNLEYVDSICVADILTAEYGDVEPSDEQLDSGQEMLGRGLSEALDLSERQFDQLVIDQGFLHVITTLQLAEFGAQVVLPDLESPENFLKGSLTLSLGLELPDLEATQMTATFNRFAYEGGSLRVNMNWNGGNYTMVLSGDLEQGNDLNLRFFNAQGYELVMVASYEEQEGVRSFAGMTGQALLDGEEIGTIEMRDDMPVLVFANGEENRIESLL